MIENSCKDFMKKTVEKLFFDWIPMSTKIVSNNNIYESALFVYNINDDTSPIPVNISYHSNLKIVNTLHKLQKNAR